MASLSVPVYRAKRLVAISGGLGLLGLGFSILGFWLSPRAALFGWLTAFSFAVSICVGALIFLMVGHAMGAKWPVAVRRLTEAVVGALPILALAFSVVGLGAKQIYIWAGSVSELDPELGRLIAHKKPYLNVGAFAIRGALYFIVWMSLATILRRWSFASDGDPGDERRAARARMLSAAALPLVGLTLTFASFDWTMSLEPAWLSSVYGVYWFAGGFVAALALLTLLAQRVSNAKLFGDRDLHVSHFHALGRLLFAFSIFWAYIAFFQALLIQIADKPREVVFYVERIQRGFAAVLVLVVLGRFVVPFFVLILRAAKRRPRLLAGLSIALVFSHYLDMYWLVMPVLGAPSAMPSWIDGATLLAISGLSVSFAAWRMNGRPLAPVGDPLFEVAMSYRSPQ